MPHAHEVLPLLSINLSPRTSLRSSLHFARHLCSRHRGFACLILFHLADIFPVSLSWRSRRLLRIRCPRFLNTIHHVWSYASLTDVSGRLIYIFKDISSLTSRKLPSGRSLFHFIVLDCRKVDLTFASDFRIRERLCGRVYNVPLPPFLCPSYRQTACTLFPPRTPPSSSWLPALWAHPFSHSVQSPDVFPRLAI